MLYPTASLMVGRERKISVIKIEIEATHRLISEALGLVTRRKLFIVVV
jgi:hypothetical protein